MPGKEKKKVDKTVASQTTASAEGTSEVSDADLRSALAKIRSEGVPSTAEEKEVAFATHVNMGEQFCIQGFTFLISFL